MDMGLRPPVHGVAASTRLPESIPSTLLAVRASVALVDASGAPRSTRVCFAAGSLPPAAAAAAAAASARLSHGRFFSCRSSLAVGHASAKASSAVLAAPKSAALGRSGRSTRQSAAGSPSFGLSALCTMAW